MRFDAEFVECDGIRLITTSAIHDAYEPGVYGVALMIFVSFDSVIRAPEFYDTMITAVAPASIISR